MSASIDWSKVELRSAMTHLLLPCSSVVGRAEQIDAWLNFVDDDGNPMPLISRELAAQLLASSPDDSSPRGQRDSESPGDLAGVFTSGNVNQATTDGKSESTGSCAITEDS